MAPAPPNPQPQPSAATAATMYTPLTTGHVNASIARRRETSSANTQQEESLGSSLSSARPVASELSTKKRISGLSQFSSRIFTSSKKAGSSKRNSTLVSESDHSKLETPHPSSSGNNTYHTRVSFSDFPIPPILPENQAPAARKDGNQFAKSDPASSTSSPPPTGGSNEQETYPLPGVLSELDPPSTVPHHGRDTNWPLDYYLVFPTVAYPLSSTKQRDVHIYRSNVAPTDLVDFIGPLPQPASEYLAMLLKTYPHRAAEIKRTGEEFMKQQDHIVQVICAYLVKAVNDQKEHLNFVKERLEYETKKRPISSQLAERVANHQQMQYTVALEKEVRINNGIMKKMTEDMKKTEAKNNGFAARIKELHAEINGIQHQRRQESRLRHQEAQDRVELESRIAQLEEQLAERDEEHERLRAFRNDYILLFENHFRVSKENGGILLGSRTADSGKTDGNATIAEGLSGDA
ncbi:hypothetical protein HYALB_00009716 [Hymenoscyphus albidus]|uniref:Uncharacterized protein n=1 Tax=Hymenoscyphus albidus TaxID=595503 RepID=A0A9N9LHP5_9HELO|nr:hypothetical protein HYALB_00009716 [Hymenoscyphus albidus]